MNTIRTKQSQSLEVQFRRTGERRYAITIHRQNQTPVEMNAAPGDDPLMPHDLLHLVIEAIV